MTMLAAVSAHVRLDDAGVARIDETNVKVIEVAVEQLAYGWSPEEIHFQHSDLSLAQIHAARAYYHDHRQEYDAAIEQQLKRAESLAAGQGDTPFRQRLRRALDAGIQQLEEGKCIDGEEVFARLERRAAEIERQANAADQ
jgi:uncharacterized protein (DUF433 family)